MPRLFESTKKRKGIASRQLNKAALSLPSPTRSSCLVADPDWDFIEDPDERDDDDHPNSNHLYERVNLFSYLQVKRCNHNKHKSHHRHRHHHHHYPVDDVIQPSPQTVPESPLRVPSPRRLSHESPSCLEPTSTPHLPAQHELLGDAMVAPNDTLPSEVEFGLPTLQSVSWSTTRISKGALVVIPYNDIVGTLWEARVVQNHRTTTRSSRKGSHHSFHWLLQFEYDDSLGHVDPSQDEVYVRGSKVQPLSSLTVGSRLAIRYCHGGFRVASVVRIKRKQQASMAFHLLFHDDNTLKWVSNLPEMDVYLLSTSESPSTGPTRPRTRSNLTHSKNFPSHEK